MKMTKKEIFLNVFNVVFCILAYFCFVYAIFEMFKIGMTFKTFFSAFIFLWISCDSTVSSLRYYKEIKNRKED